MSKVILREIAHARAGDKGNRSNVSLWLYEAQHYDAVAAQLTLVKLHMFEPCCLHAQSFPALPVNFPRGVKQDNRLGGLEQLQLPVECKLSQILQNLAVSQVGMHLPPSDGIP